MRNKFYIVLFAFHFSLITVSAQSFFGDVRIDTRVGYNIGGTMPVPMPATIRKLVGCEHQRGLRGGKTSCRTLGCADRSAL